jgi:hypothetical protein
MKKLTKQDTAIMKKFGEQATKYGAADLVDYNKALDIARMPASAKNRNTRRAFIGLAPSEVSK